MRLYGKRSVLERLKVAPKTIKNVYLQEGFSLDEVLRAIKAVKRPTIYLPKHKFDKSTRNLHTQGVIAEVEDYIYVSFDALLEFNGAKRPTLLFLDSITDPQNIGAILRTAACLGGFAVVLPKYESCQITEAVLRVAQGAENYVPVSQVNNLAKALQFAKDVGYQAAAAVVEGGENIFKAKLPFPLSLVIGSESRGVRAGLAKNIDLKLTLPMFGAGLSFNVSVATALFCYEVTRQRTMA